MTQHPILKAEKIYKNFGYRRLLLGLDLEINPGEFTLLLGRNGEGKSTLLKIISGLTLATKGQIFFEGTPAKENPAAFRASFGMISHAPHLYNDLTAKENLLFFAKLRKIKNAEEKTLQALKKVGLGPFTNTQIATFSSGMFKRLNIAKLMVFEPKILLLDEPYTGLDYDSISFFNDYLRDFKAQGGAILMITHQIDTCFDQCDKILVLQKGLIRPLGLNENYTYEELLTRYQNHSS